MKDTIDGIGRRQFLLSKNKAFDLNWPSTEVGDYALFYHPDIEHSSIEYDGKVIHLVGEVFDWKFPAWTTQDVLSYLVKQPVEDTFFEALARFMGHFMLLFQSEDDFFLLNDACGQYEVFYSSDFTVVGSQVKLMERVMTGKPHHDADARAFFKSPEFKSKKIFVGDYTHLSNVSHLRPNHLVDLKNQRVDRFFPTTECVHRTLEEAASLGSEMIGGYVAAIANRHRIAVPVTAGYDSRVLFLASLELNAHFFISRHRGMSDAHVDIATAQQLAKLMNVDFHVVEDLPKPADWLESDFELSIDFPRYVNRLSNDFENCVYLNGNCGEVARNYFGSFAYYNGDDLARMLGYPKASLAKKVCRNWLSENGEMLKSMRYNALDIFYWEEKMGNWGAKKRTETNAIGRVVYSPFNSRALFEVLLGTKRAYRDSHRNVLYNGMLRNLHSKSMVQPINPTRKNRVILLLKKLGVYDFYRFVGFRSGVLKA